MIVRIFSGLTVAAFFALSLLSCEKEVTLDLPGSEGAYLIVEANIDDASALQWIKLSLSSSYYDVTEGAAVSGAFVTVFSDDKSWTFAERLDDSLPGLYFSSDIGRALEPGKYMLFIEHEGKTYTAASEYKKVPAVDSVTTRLNFFSASGFTSEDLFDVLVHFTNLPDRGNHYLIDLSINRKLRTQRPGQKTVLSDEDLGDYVSRSVGTINGKDINEGDTIRLEMRSISRGKYDFYQIFFFQTDLSGNPFAGAPPANIPTNMSEGAKGFFQVSSVSSEKVIFRK